MYVALSTLILSLSSSPAAAGGLLLEASIDEAGGINPCVLVALPFQAAPAVHTLVASLDGELSFGDLDADASIVVGVGVPDAEVTELAVPAGACGNRSDLVLYPLADGERVTLDGDCAAAPVLRATLDDGSVLDLSMELTGGDRFASPGSLVGFNPQPEPPGMPAAVQLQPIWSDDAPSSLAVELLLTDGDGRAYSLQ